MSRDPSAMKDRVASKVKDSLYCCTGRGAMEKDNKHRLGDMELVTGMSQFLLPAVSP